MTATLPVGTVRAGKAAAALSGRTFSRFIADLINADLGIDYDTAMTDDGPQVKKPRRKA